MNMNKKIMQGLVATCLAVSSVSMGVGPVVQPIVAMASDLTEGYAEITLGGTTSIGDTNVISLADAGITASAAGEVIIPETVEYEGVTYKITSIGEQAFYKKTGIKSITIPASVKTIGINAFAGCSGMTSVNLSEGLISIEDKAFQGCTKLTTINLPSSLESLGDYVFYNNKVMTEITLPEGLKTMGDYVFYKCAALKTVSFPSTLEGIGAFTFQECTNLESVNLAEGIKSIGESAFAGCTKLTSIDLPESLSSIGSSTFDGCSGITQISIGVSEIPYRAFRNCTGLTSVTFKEGVESIGSTAFGGCTSLSNIDLPDSLTLIDEYAFYKCTSLTSIAFPKGLEKIGTQAFDSCSGLENIDFSDGLDTIAKNAFANCGSLKEIILPEGLTFIGEEAFYECSNVQRISIPSTVHTTGVSAFYGCVNLTDLIIAEGVQTISAFSFYNCNSLETITLPSTVENVLSQAFYGCTKLKELNIQCDSANLEISSQAFYGCDSISEINYNYARAYGIYTNAFYSDIERDVYIYLIDTNTVAANYNYDGDNINPIFEETPTVTLFTTTSIDNKQISLADAGIEESGEVNIPTEVNYDGTTYVVARMSNTFSNNSEVTSVVLPTTVTDIDGAFTGCDNLESVTISSNVETVTEDSFQVDEEKELEVIIDSEDAPITNYDFAADNIVATFSLRRSAPSTDENTGSDDNTESGDNTNSGDDTGSDNTTSGGETSNQNDMAVTGYITPITEMDVTIPLDGFRFHIDENRDLIPTISNLENDSQFPLDVNALNINGSTGTEPSVIAESTYTEYQWNNMNKADTLSKMALYLNGSELFNIFQNDSLDSNKAINIGRLESGFSGTSTLEVTPDAQYGKNFGNRTDMLTFVYDLVLEFAVPMS